MTRDIRSAESQTVCKIAADGTRIEATRVSLREVYEPTAWELGPTAPDGTCELRHVKDSDIWEYTETGEGLPSHAFSYLPSWKWVVDAGRVVETTSTPNASPEPLFVLRLWDMFDGWMDIGQPVSRSEADAAWAEKTGNGTHHTTYGDGDYYRVYPADTRMVVTPEFLGR